MLRLARPQATVPQLQHAERRPRVVVAHRHLLQEHAAAEREALQAQDLEAPEATEGGLA